MKLIKCLLFLSIINLIFPKAFCQDQNNSVEVGALLSFPDNFNVKSILGVIDNEIYGTIKSNVDDVYGIIKFNESMQSDGVVLIPKTIEGKQVDYLSSRILDGSVMVLVDVFIKKDYKVYGYSLNTQEMKLSEPKLIFSYPMKRSQHSGLSWRTSTSETALGFMLNLDSKVKKEGFKKYYASVDKNFNRIFNPSEIFIPAYDEDDKVIKKITSNSGEFFMLSKSIFKGKEKQDSKFDFYLHKVALNGSVSSIKVNLNGNELDDFELKELQNGNIVLYGWDERNGFLDHYIFIKEYDQNGLKEIKGGYTKVSTEVIVDHAHKNSREKLIKKIENGTKISFGGKVFVEELLEGENGQLFVIACWKHEYMDRTYTLVLGLNEEYNEAWMVNIANCQSGFYRRSPYLLANGDLKIVFEDNALNKNISAGQSAEYVYQNFDNEEKLSSAGVQVKSSFSPIRQEIREVIISDGELVERGTLMNVASLSAKEDAARIFANEKEKGEFENPLFKSNFTRSVISDGYLYVYQTAKLSYNFKIMKQKAIEKYIARFVKIKL